MDYAINDREPTITAIKEKITVLKEKIIEYQTLHENIYTSPTSETNDNIVDIEILNTKRSFIISELNNINSLINRISPRIDENRTKINSNVSKLINTFNVMNVEFDKLEAELEKPIELIGHYEMSKMKTSANYGNYIMFLLFAIFIIGCLIYIYKNPEGGNLDMFILGLALIILAYYLYEYYVTKIKKT